MVASARPGCGDGTDDIAELPDIPKKGYIAVAQLQLPTTEGCETNCFELLSLLQS